MTTFSLTARRALAFAQQHDWGQRASLAMIEDQEAVVGLEDWYSVRQPDGTWKAEMTPAQRPATISAIREFGNY